VLSIIAELDVILSTEQRWRWRVVVS